MFIARWPWPEIIINCTVITATTKAKIKQNVTIHKYENTVIQRNCQSAVHFYSSPQFIGGITTVHSQLTPVHFTAIQ